MLLVLVLFMKTRSPSVSQAILTPTVIYLPQLLSAGVAVVNHHAHAHLHGFIVILLKEYKWSQYSSLFVLFSGEHQTKSIGHAWPPMNP